MAEYAAAGQLREHRMVGPDAEAAYEAAWIEFELRQAIRELRRRDGQVRQHRWAHRFPAGWTGGHRRRAQPKGIDRRR